MPHHLTSFQLGVLFLPQTLQSIPQFSCTEKSHSSRVIANCSFIVSLKYCCENLTPSSWLDFYMHVQDGVALGKTIKTKLVALCWKGDEEDPSIVRLPVPYQLPPQPYGTQG